MGLSPRYNALSGFDCAENVLDFGGTGGANTSIWLCGWGEDTLHGIFPKGSQAGLQIKDLGEQTLLDDNGGHYQGYRSHFKWDCGLSLRDWRYAVRICNIDTASFADIINGSADFRRHEPDPPHDCRRKQNSFRQQGANGMVYEQGRQNRFGHHGYGKSQCPAFR